MGYICQVGFCVLRVLEECSSSLSFDTCDQFLGCKNHRNPQSRANVVGGWSIRVERKISQPILFIILQKDATMKRIDGSHRMLFPPRVAATVICLLLHLSLVDSGNARVRSRAAHDSNQESDRMEGYVAVGADANLSLKSVDELDVEVERSRLLVTTSSSVLEDTGRQEEIINVIVGFKEDKHTFLQGQSPSHSQVAWPTELPVVRKFSRINAEVVRVSRTDMHLLANDPNVAFVEEDRKMVHCSETVPWGIPAIQANGTKVPAPDKQNFDPDEKCFNICIVDGGFALGHPDLVRNGFKHTFRRSPSDCFSFSLLPKSLLSCIMRFECEALFHEG
jgi:hypothetical protein